jgi:hypothetical protein
MVGTLGAFTTLLALAVTGGQPCATCGHEHRGLFPPASEGGLFFRHHKETPRPLPASYVNKPAHPKHRNWVLPDGPGDGWGFPNGNPDVYGYADYGYHLPLGGDRTTDYFFPRQLSALPEQTFLPSYYNPYQQRGQRYIPYAGCGGDHPLGRTLPDALFTPVMPADEAKDGPPMTTVPTFSGRSDAPPSSNTFISPRP